MTVASDATPAGHWDGVYQSRGETGVSWFQTEPRMSLEMLTALVAGPESPVIDVGGGASTLVDALIKRSFRNLCVLDVSAAALRLARARLGNGAGQVEWVEHDILTWQPWRVYGVWHDRAVFHFLVDEEDQRRYLRVLREATGPGSHVILATFAADGPDHCSGLPVARYSGEQLACVIGGGFEVVATRQEEHLTPGGAVQRFTWLAATVADSTRMLPPAQLR